MGFGNFKPKEDLGTTGYLDRQAFAGVAPAAAARRLRDFVAKNRGKVLLTLDAYEGMARRVLNDLGEQGIDLSTVTAEDLVRYRQYLQERVDQGGITDNYGAHIVVHWNAFMRSAFGAGHVKRGRCLPPCPAETLTITQGFPRSAKKINRLTEEDFDLMREQIRKSPAATAYQYKGSFSSEHWKRAFGALYELYVSTGCRYASSVSVRACDVDFASDPPRVNFPHLKNRKYLEEFVPPRLSALAARALHQFIQYLQETPLWKGPETLLFTNEKGEALANQNINQALKRVALLAGVDVAKKAVSTHTIRKAVGTIVGKNSKDPKRGARHLNISEKVFFEHYFQPDKGKDQDEIVDFLPKSRFDDDAPAPVPATPPAPPPSPPATPA